ncbi:MAG: hypothetical protein KAH33_02790, partial [Candidatus Delongbacteria bacterium]|nr:hypothetical protein [Candidatus Delongbacteria bacterium]
MKYRLSHYIEYYIMLVFQLIIRILPLKAVVLIASCLASTISLFYKVRNDIVLDNLSIAFPDKSIKEKKNIRDEMYKQILMSMFESYKYMYLSNEKKLDHIFIDEESKDNINKVLEADKGCIVVGGHYGFFEGAAHLGTCIGLKSSVVVANQKNKLTEKLI